MRTSFLSFAALAVLSACSFDTRSAPQPVPSQELDLQAVMASVRTHWRATGNGFVAAVDSFDVAASAEGYELGSSWKLGAAQLRRGPVGSPGGASLSAEGALLSRALTASVTERVAVWPSYAEQSWAFDREPEGTGDLVVRVPFSGLSHVATTASGLHFADAEGGAGFRYGHATFVDARGVRTNVTARVVDGAIELVVAESLLAASGYPAVLDPVISAESGVDVPVYGSPDRNQEEPVVAFDGTNYLVVWNDSRGWPSHLANIYGARVTPSGTVLDESGIAIAVTPDTEADPAVALVGSNYLVVWRRGGTAGSIEGVRITSAGAIVDSTPIKISATAGSVEKPAVASSGASALVVWTANTGGTTDSDIHGRVISSSGVLSGGADIVITQATALQQDVAIGASSSGYLVAWSDTRGGGSADVYGSRVTFTGVVEDPAGITISGAAGTQSSPTVASNGTDFFVAWQDSRTSLTTTDVYAARVTAAAVVQDPAGIAVSTATANQTVPSAIWDGANYQLVWQDTRGSSAAVYAARVSSAGAVLEPTGVSVVSSFKTTPAIGRGASGALVAYVSSSDVHATTLTNGTSPGTTFRVSSAADYQYEPALAFDGTNYLLAWTSRGDLYAAQVNPSGAASSAFAVHVGSATQDQPAVACSTVNCVVAYHNGSGISARRVSKAGTLIDATPIALSNPTGSEYEVKVAFDGTDYVFAFTNQNVSNFDIYAGRLTTAGVLRDSTGLLVAGGTVSQHNPVIASNGTNTVIAYDVSGGANINHVWVRPMTNSTGAATLGTAVQLSGTFSANIYPAIASDGSNYLVAWKAYNSTGPSRIAAVRISAAGAASDSPELLPGSPTAGEEEPVIAWTGARYLLLWREDGTPGDYNWDLKGAEVPAAGAASASFVVSATESDELTPAVAGGGGGAMVAYSRMVYQAPYGSHRIQLRVISPTGTPTANPQAATLAEDTPKALLLTGTDPEGSQLTFAITRQPANGTLSGSAPNVTYTPSANFNGTDSFAFTVSDGALTSPAATVTVTVTPVNDAPVANAQTVQASEDTPRSVTLTATDVDGDALTFSVLTQPSRGTLSGTGATLTYTPAANTSGADAFTFRAADAISNSTATVTINVAPVNDPPTANAQSLSTPEDTPLSITLTGADIDNGSLGFSIATNPVNGTLSGTPPDVVYTPAANFYGADTFRFRATDGQASSSLATVTLTVTAVNDAPLAEGFALATMLNTPQTLLLRGVDPEGEPLTFTVSQPSHGTVDGAGAQRVYTPQIGYSGADSFTYTASDGLNSSAPVTVFITIETGNRAPIAEPFEVTIAEGATAQLTLRATDADGDALTWRIVGNPTFGTLTGGGPSPIVTYKPRDGFTGLDTFSFEANDGKIASVPANVSVRVQAVAKSGGCGCTGGPGAPMLLLLGAAGATMRRRRR